MGIKVGDKIYILKERNDWSQYQVIMIVTEVTTWPSYRKGRARAYRGIDSKGGYMSTWHTGCILGKSRPVVRKTPYPFIPLVTC